MLRSNFQIPFGAILLSFLVSTADALSNGTVIPLKSSSYGLWYTAELDFGGQTLSVITDTGSADLWVLAEKWQCLSLNGTSIPRTQCSFNQSYEQSSTFTAENTAYLAEVYGQGTIIGPVGYEDVKIGEMKIEQQEMAFINSTTHGVDKSVSGIMGLAFPALDGVHPVDFVPTNINPKNPWPAFLKDRIAYPTVLKRLQEMGMTYFSFAMERTPVNQETGFGGHLSFGTLPPGSPADDEFTTIPVEILQDAPLYLSNGTQQISYWTLAVEAVTWENQKNSSSQAFQAVVDSGNGLNYVPASIASEVCGAYDPPGKFVPSDYACLVQCDAAPPAGFAVQIGGTTFNINSADMIIPDGLGNCVSSVGNSPPAFGTNFAILGAAFLKNVVAVFDFEKQEMRFASTQTNSSSSSPPPSTGGVAAVWDRSAGAMVLAAAMLVAALI